MNRRPENIVLVDNSPLAFIQSISNGVPIVDFCNDNPKDNELAKLAVFLKTLLPLNDVRPVIRKKFKMRHYKSYQKIETLSQHLIEEYSAAMKHTNFQVQSN